MPGSAASPPSRPISWAISAAAGAPAGKHLPPRRAPAARQRGRIAVTDLEVEREQIAQQRVGPGHQALVGPGAQAMQTLGPLLDQLVNS
jgi:hypothetical protein